MSSSAGGWIVDCELDDLPQRDGDGRVFLMARVPRIKRQFTSALHAPDSLTYRLGGWRTELSAFRGGKLPSARLSEETSREAEQAAVRQAVVAAIEEGYAGSLRVNAEGDVYGYLARPDRIADTINLEALHVDWTAWLTLAGVYETEDAGSIRDEVADAIEELRDSCYSDFLHKLGDLKYNFGPVYGGLMDGIVLGDDPASTCAFFLKDLTGDGRLWESTR